ncbi:MAG: hypothetical protein LBT97_09690 [Planctomycetota bacterium]|nr:hypothetical protein [Planctomycetota bacterium]
MKFSTITIEKSLNSGFRSKYKAFVGFVDSEYWNRCMFAVRDKSLLERIVFCNDVMEIPPAHTFLRAKPISADLQDFDKRGIGAFWGYVFKFVFGYRNQKSVTARVNTVRTATYFFDIAEAVEIVKAGDGE